MIHIVNCSTVVQGQQPLFMKCNSLIQEASEIIKENRLIGNIVKLGFKTILNGLFFSIYQKVSEVKERKSCQWLIA